MNSGPTVQRRVGRELKRLREAAGLDQAQAAEAIHTDRTTISKLEWGRRRLRMLELKALLDLYDAAPDDRDYLLDLARTGGERGWWARYTSSIQRNYASFIGFESDAVDIRVCNSLVVPGQLQTEAYARAMMDAAPDISDAERDRAVEIRMARQAQLAKTQPRMHVVLDESVLNRTVGSGDVMAGQLQRLIDAAEEPQIDIRIVPLALGAHAAGIDALTILSYAEDPDIVSIETMTGDLYPEGEEARRCIVAFDHLRSAALDPEASMEALRAALGRSA